MHARQWSPFNTKSPGPRPTSVLSGILIYPVIWPQQIWAENWGAVSIWGGGAGSPSNTMWPGLRPACAPSFILIHPTIWPQYINVTDRTDKTDRTGQDRQTDRQRSDSIGRTVLQTVSQLQVTTLSKPQYTTFMQILQFVLENCTYNILMFSILIKYF